jgi:hypothetical protein
VAALEDSMRLFPTVALLTVVLSGCASAPRDQAKRAISPGAAWRHGPRDSVRAVGMACELLTQVTQHPAGTSCRIEAYHETLTEIIVRIRQVPDAGADPVDFPISEVRLTKDGANAVVSRFPTL